MQSYPEQLPGTIVFLHQHAEELTPGGAKPILESGALDHVDAIFGTHLWAPLPVGVLQTAKSTLMAGEDRFENVTQGVGGQGDAPPARKAPLVIVEQITRQM